MKFSETIHPSDSDPKPHATVKYFDAAGNEIANPNPKFGTVWHVYP